MFGHQAAKQAVARDICKLDSTSELPAWAISSCAGGSAAVAAIVTNPMDVVKLRLQARPIAPSCWAQLLYIDVAACYPIFVTDIEASIFAFCTTIFSVFTSILTVEQLFYVPSLCMYFRFSDGHCTEPCYSPYTVPYLLMPQ